MYVYESEAPPRLWQCLKEIADQGGPSGYNTMGESGEAAFAVPGDAGGPAARYNTMGESGEAAFPPAGNSQ